MFVYFWFPGFIFPALSLFAWMTWIAPDNFNLNMITGSQMGLGFNPISSFDWNVISTALPPLASPFFAFVQQFTGAVLAGFIIIALYYSNVSWAAYLPPNSSGIFDNTGNSYNISRILNPNSAIVDEAAYQEYSPAFYGAGNLVLYGAFFAFYPLTMVFIVLDMWRPILKAYRSMSSNAASSIKRFFVGLKDATSSLFRGNLREAGKHLAGIVSNDSSIYDGFDDPFTKMMRNYPEVPDSWFLIIAFIAFIFALS